MLTRYLKFTRKRTNQSKDVKSFAKNEDGATAIEFGLVATPFFLLMFAIMEIALVFIAEININYATYLTARKVRTLNPAITDVNSFKQDVCNTVFFVPNCIGKLRVEAQVWAEFDDIAYTNPALDGNGNLAGDGSFAYNIGGSNSIVTIRTIYEWDMMANIPLVGFGNMGNGNRMIIGFAAFRSE